MLIGTVIALDEGQALTTLSNHLTHSLCCSQLCGLQHVSSPLWASVNSLVKWRQKEWASAVLSTDPWQALIAICHFPLVILVFHLMERAEMATHPPPTCRKTRKDSGRVKPAAEPWLSIQNLRPFDPLHPSPIPKDGTCPRGDICIKTKLKLVMGRLRWAYSFMWHRLG